jgi:hypothetical protein
VSHLTNGRVYPEQAARRLEVANFGPFLVRGGIMPSDSASTNPQPRPERGAPRDCNAQMREHLGEARTLLCLANRKGVRIPTDILADVIEAERACVADSVIDLDLETRFWHAYGVLRRTIEPATKARRFYRLVFYGALALMLLVQSYYLIGSQVHERLQDTNPANLEVYGNLAPSLLFFIPGLSADIAVALLKTILDFVAAYLLPALYGLLGACAFVLRQLSNDVSTLKFADDSRVRYTLRLNIGVLAGLAVGWFIDPSQEGSVVANLSPLALAFVAGYGSDLLFAVLDRIVNAFSTQPAAEAPAPGAHTATGLEAVPERPASKPQAAAARSASNGKSSQRGKRTGTNGADLQPEPALAD